MKACGIVRIMMKTKKLLEMFEEADSIVNQMNLLSYNNPEDRALLESHENRLDLIHGELSGKPEATIKREKLNSQKLYLQ